MVEPKADDTSDLREALREAFRDYMGRCGWDFEFVEVQCRHAWNDAADEYADDMKVPLA